MGNADSERMRALIVDDEEPGRNVLRALLAREEGVDVAGEAGSTGEATRMIADQQPDVLFLDIEMPGGGGIELMRSLSDPAPCVILVTAHPEYTLPAFELEAVDYLVKPVQRPRFSSSVQRARQRVTERRLAGLAIQIAGTAQHAGAAAQSILPQPRYPDHLSVRVRRRLLSLEMNEIIWIQGASQYSRVHTKNGEYLLSRTLASLECELDPRKFFRIHRSAIVNALHVHEVRSCGDGRYNIFLECGQALPMGRARREILEKLLQGIGGRGH